MQVQVLISPDVRKAFQGVSLGVGVLAGASIREASEELEAFKREVEERLRGELVLEELKDHPVVRVYRDFYWRIGIDPTKQRPSSEALARRILRGKSLPRINTAVDAYNVASLETLISIGAYDLDNVELPAVLRKARAGEVFVELGGKSEELEEGELVIADAEKVLNVYPHRDSDLTKITLETENILVVACGVPGISPGCVYEAAEKALRYIQRFCGGEVKELKAVV